MKNARQVPRISHVMAKAFAFYCRRYLRRNFHALRILRDGLPRTGERPLVIYLNHASWWDPIVCLLLAREVFPARTSFAPIDAEMLQRYGILRQLGFFPVDHTNISGPRNFLRTSQAILLSSQHALWLTPQGRFVDARERPLYFQSGLGALAARHPDALFLPLAIEYTFWTEPRPEILVAFGEAILPNELPNDDAQSWTARFEDALAATQDKLCRRSFRRQPREWIALSRGATGVNLIYDALRAAAARLHGRKFAREHQLETAS